MKSSIKVSLLISGVTLIAGLALAGLKANSETPIRVVPLEQIVSQLPSGEISRIKSIIQDEIIKDQAGEPIERREELEIEDRAGSVSSIEEANKKLLQLKIKVPGWLPSGAELVGVKVEIASSPRQDPAERAVLFYETPTGMIQIREELHQAGVQVIFRRKQSIGK
jgi:hypothetical protein